MTDQRRHCDQLDSRLAEYERGTLKRFRAAALIESPTGKSWFGYAAAGGTALSSAMAANAEIVHVVPSNPFTVDADNNQVTGIDLDGDQIYDLLLGAAGYNIGTEFQPVNLRFGTLRGIDAAIVPSAYPFNTTDLGEYRDFAVRNYAPDEMISPFNANSGSYIRTSQTGFITPTNHGQWNVSDIGYAGVALNFGEPSARAGWIKVRTRRAGNRLDKVDVLEWAYESTPNVPIKAGDTSSTVSIPGDYSGNDSVGPEDYQLWASQHGQTVNPAGTGPDGDQDGRIGPGDYTVWRNNLSPAGAGQLANLPVPEPSTITLGILALGAAGIAALRRKK